MSQPLSFPRQDSSLLNRSNSGQGSQGHASTQDTIDHTWNETRAGLGYNMDQPQGREEMERHHYTTQGTVDDTWDETGAGFGYNMAQLQGREQMQRHENTEYAGEFFAYDNTNTSTSLIPPGYEPTQQSQYVLQTPSPTQGPEDDAPQYGRGFRQRRSPKRLDPSGRRQPRAHR